MTEQKVCWTGGHGPSAIIARGTNPWVELDGVPIAYSPSMQREGGPCGLPIHVVPGVLNMDDNEGLQRCDECDLYPGDLEAAAAVAKTVDPRARVWFYPAYGPEGAGI